MTLCKLTGQPAPPDVSPDLAVIDLVITPDPATPVAPCGSTPGNGGAPVSSSSGDGSGLPSAVPSPSPLPLPSLSPIVP